MNMDPIEYRIHGSDLQYVEVRLAPGRCAVAEPGAMMYVDDDVQVNTELGDGSGRETNIVSRLWRGIRRSFSGESLFTSTYANDAMVSRRVAFAAASTASVRPRRTRRRAAARLSKAPKAGPLKWANSTSTRPAPTSWCA